MTKKIFIIAGEASGDLYGSNLIQHLRTESKNPLEIYGIGGDKIKQTGALEFFDLAHFHVTGISAAIKKLPEYKKASGILLEKISRIRPDLVVLIDNPGFNLHLAKKIHALNIPIVYYIAPQVWAWAPKRILKIKAYVKKVLVVFEFEKKIYEDHQIPVTWTGHPLIDLMNEIIPKKIEKEKLLISLLPGSRRSEIKYLLPIYVKAAKIISEKIPGCAFRIIKAHTQPLEYYQQLLEKEDFKVPIEELDSYRVIKASDFAIVCSGTATLECALLGAPMVICYRGSVLSYLAAKIFIKVPYIGLPNLIMGDKKFPELWQYNVTPEKIAAQTIQILTDENTREATKESLKEVSRRVGGKGATKRAAEEILELL